MSHQSISQIGGVVAGGGGDKLDKNETQILGSQVHLEDIFEK